MSKRTIYKLLALLLGCTFLALFVGQIDFQLVSLHLTKVGWQFVWLLVVSGSAYLMATIAWYLCLPNATHLSLFQLFNYRLIGETLAVINPTNIIGGESAKIYLLKKVGVAYKAGLTSILLSRILIMLSMVALFLLLPFGLIDPSVNIDNFGSYLLPLFVLVLFFVSTFLAFVHPSLWLFRALKYLAKRLDNPFLHKMLPKGEEINELMATFYQQHRGRLVLAFWLSFFHWIMGAVEMYLILSFLGIEITLWEAILLEVGITCFKSMGAFIPGQIGVEEYGNKLMLTLAGISGGSTWVVVSILRRTRQLFWLGLGCLSCLLIYPKLTKVEPQTI
ncbi:MAG: flippase-like domain-containing protein [Bacteroidota bacterium]